MGAVRTMQVHSARLQQRSASRARAQSKQCKQCKRRVQWEIAMISASSARTLSARGECSGSNARAMLSAKAQCKQCKRRVQWELPVFDINASNSRRGVAAVHHCTQLQKIQLYKFTTTTKNSRKYYLDGINAFNSKRVNFKIQNYKFTELGD